jgi:Holliday junction resolvase
VTTRKQGSSSVERQDVFRDAKLLYEAVVISGLVADPHSVAEKMKQLAAGLPTEDEFACLAAWSSRCRLIHKLDQEQVPPESRDEYQVPDFLAIFQGTGAELTILVEVKKSSPNVDKKLFQTRLSFSESYYRRLTRYAEMLGLPLLVAWKADPVGWMLFDIRRPSLVKTARHITLDEALKDNLLGVIMGDFNVTLSEGCAWVMELDRQSQKVGGKCVAKLTDLYYANPEGERVQPIAEPFFHMFAYIGSSVDMREKGRHIVQRCVTVNEEGFWAHWLLYPAAHGLRAEEADWRGALRRGGFRYTLADALRTAEDAARKGMIKQIIQQVPQNVPDFLGGDYESLQERGFGWAS